MRKINYDALLCTGTLQTENKGMVQQKATPMPHPEHPAWDHHPPTGSPVELGHGCTMLEPRSGCLQCAAVPGHSSVCANCPEAAAAIGHHGTMPPAAVMCLVCLSASIPCPMCLTPQQRSSSMSGHTNARRRGEPVGYFTPVVSWIQGLNAKWEKPKSQRHLPLSCLHTRSIPPPPAASKSSVNQMHRYITTRHDCILWSKDKIRRHASVLIPKASSAFSLLLCILCTSYISKSHFQPGYPHFFFLPLPTWHFPSSNPASRTGNSPNYQITGVAFQNLEGLTHFWAS